MAAPTMPVFDAHLHIIDGRFPLMPNQGYLPEPFDAGDYRRRMAGYRLVGGAIVSGSFQGFDQQYLIHAIATLGPQFVGVTQIPHTTPDADIVALDRAGIRAVRFNVRRGGSETVNHLERLAKRVHDLVGWHTELYIDSADLEPLYEVLCRLPKISIDHLGLSFAGYRWLLKLVEQGARIKATGFGRVALDVPTALRQIHGINPGALLFGTDLPSTRASRPYEDRDVDLVREALGDACIERVFHANAVELYHRTPAR